jgi:hypothetical protein
MQSRRWLSRSRDGRTKLLDEFFREHIAVYVGVMEDTYNSVSMIRVYVLDCHRRW